MKETNWEEEWIKDCLYWYGKVLTGAKRHWCPEFDGLPIDENSSEFEFCNCNIITKEEADVNGQNKGTGSD